jgi:uncharacterized membrane protein
MNRRSFDVLAAAIYALAVAVWLGGIVVLGAIVAPTVFRNVPAPTSADAMTLVFGRFDRVAMSCAAIALVAEAALAIGIGKGTTKKALAVDLVRAASVVLAGGLAIAVGAWLSPGISALHRGGAVRGSGGAGLELERLHRMAEAAGKGQVLLLVAVLVLLLVRVARGSRASDSIVREDRPTA